MATDATGVPTPLGIPKIDPSVDAPSGLGTNAAMDSIDTLITARPAKPAGIVSGEAMVWNGTTWVRSSATNIGPASLGSGTPDATKFLRGDGAWASAVQELAYAQITAPVTLVSVTESAGTAIVTAPAITVDGSTKIKVEAFSPALIIGTVGNSTIVSLFEGSTQLCRIMQTASGGATGNTSGKGEYIFTPTAGTHTYSLTGVTSGGATNGQVFAGPGGTAGYAPAFIRITRAN